MIEIHHAPNGDSAPDLASPSAPVRTWTAPSLALESDLDLPAALDLDALHAELASVPAFAGLVLRDGALHATWKQAPSKSAVDLAHVRTRAHKLPPGRRDVLGRP